MSIQRSDFLYFRNEKKSNKQIKTIHICYLVTQNRSIVRSAHWKRPNSWRSLRWNSLFFANLIICCRTHTSRWPQLSAFSLAAASALPLAPISNGNLFIYFPFFLAKKMVVVDVCLNILWFKLSTWDSVFNIRISFFRFIKLFVLAPKWESMKLDFIHWIETIFKKN